MNRHCSVDDGDSRPGFSKVSVRAFARIVLDLFSL